MIRHVTVCDSNGRQRTLKALDREGLIKSGPCCRLWRFRTGWVGSVSSIFPLGTSSKICRTLMTCRSQCVPSDILHAIVDQKAIKNHNNTVTVSTLSDTFDKRVSTIGPPPDEGADCRLKRLLLFMTLLMAFSSSFGFSLFL